MRGYYLITYTSSNNVLVCKVNHSPGKKQNVDTFLQNNIIRVVSYLYGLKIGKQQVLVTLFNQHDFFFLNESMLCLS